MIKRKAVFRCFTCKVEREEKQGTEQACRICGNKMTVVKKGVITK